MLDPDDRTNAGFHQFHKTCVKIHLNHCLDPLWLEFVELFEKPLRQYTGKKDQNHTKTICWKSDGFLMVFSEKASLS